MLPQNTQKIALLSAFFLACLARAASGHAADAGLLSGDVWIHSLHIAAACSWLGIISCYLWAMIKDKQQTHLSDRHHAFVRSGYVMFISLSVNRFCRQFAYVSNG
jgi:putative copper export protein